MASRFPSPWGSGRGPVGRGEPFMDLQREMNRLFDDVFQGFGRGERRGTMLQPRIDVHDLGEAIEIAAELPGVVQDDIDIQLDGDMLTLRGEKRQERKDERAHVLERSYGAFERTIQLTFAPDPEQVQANFENGVLRIRLLKQEQQERSRRIPIGGQAGGQTIEGSAARSGGGNGGSPQSGTSAGSSDGMNG